MGGWKQVGSVVLCDEPCCPGYREVVEKPPVLNMAVVICAKNPNAAKDFERMVQLKNDIHSYWQ
jgi:hypothetical protein